MRRFGRESAHRISMLKNLCVSLIKHKFLVTTLAKAKDLKRVMDKLITRACKGNTLHNRRILMQKVHASQPQGYNKMTKEERVEKKNTVIDQLFEIASQYKVRKGGYTSVLRYGVRDSDCSQMARIEILSDVQNN